MGHWETTNDIYDDFDIKEFITDQPRGVVGDIEFTHYRLGELSFHLVFYSMEGYPESKNLVQMYLLVETKDIREIDSDFIKTRALEIYDKDFIPYHDANL